MRSSSAATRGVRELAAHQQDHPGRIDRDERGPIRLRLVEPGERPERRLLDGIHEIARALSMRREHEHVAGYRRPIARVGDGFHALELRALVDEEQRTDRRNRERLAILGPQLSNGGCGFLRADVLQAHEPEHEDRLGDVTARRRDLASPRAVHHAQRLVVLLERGAHAVDRRDEQVDCLARRARRSGASIDTLPARDAPLPTMIGQHDSGARAATSSPMPTSPCSVRRRRYCASSFPHASSDSASSTTRVGAGASTTQASSQHRRGCRPKGGNTREPALHARSVQQASFPDSTVREHAGPLRAVVQGDAVG